MPEIIGQLAWPLAMIIIVVILRKPLSQLVQTTRRVKYKDVEVEFSRQLQQLEVEAAEAIPDEARKIESDGERNVSIDLHQLADSAPNTAVTEAWKSVEQAARHVIDARGHAVDGDAATPYKQIQELLVREKIIDEQSVRVFDKLRILRNKVVHADGFELSSEQAREYVDLAMKLRSYLEFLADERVT